MRRSTFKLSKSTKRVMALAMRNKVEADAFKNIMIDAQITYETLKHRKAKDKPESAGE